MASEWTPQGPQLVTGYREMPSKVAGQHRWIAIVTHYVTDDAAAAMYDPERSRTVYLDHESIVDTGVACVDCEEPWTSVGDKPCRAVEYPWNKRDRSG